MRKGWNFGPPRQQRGASLEDYFPSCPIVGRGASWEVDGGEHPHEASYLKLDCSKALSQLNWKPVLDLEKSLSLTADWYRAFQNRENMRTVTEGQIDDFLRQAN